MPSSLIHRFAYDPAEQTLSVWLLPSRRRYDYLDVPAEIFEGFRAAFSKGRFFNAFIRDRFPFKREAVDMNTPAGPD